MYKVKICLIFILLFTISSCSYIKEKKDQWFGGDEPEYTAPVVEVVEEPVEETVEEEEASTETE